MAVRNPHWPEMRDTDFDGCHRACRKAGVHTGKWGGCAYAEKPEQIMAERLREDGDLEITWREPGGDTFTVTTGPGTPEVLLVTTSSTDGTRILAVELRRMLDLIEGRAEAVTTYPHPSGGFQVLGPEVSATADGQLIWWRGVEFVPRCTDDNGMATRCPDEEPR